MKKFVTVKIDGVAQTHMVSFDANYATMCGLDGATEEWDGGITVTTPRSAKVNCETCLRIWQTVQQYRLSDFELAM